MNTFFGGELFRIPVNADGGDAAMAPAAGRSAIPKSTKPARIAENLDIFDFELASGELAAIDALDTGVRGGPEPDQITLETFKREIPDA